MLGMDLLLGKSQNLMAVLVIVFATADMNPEVTIIGGLHGQLVKVDVVLLEDKPRLRATCRCGAYCRPNQSRH